MDNKFDYINNLMSYYQDLLSQRQKEVLRYYYYEDLSLSEIAENLNISRNGVYDALKKAEKALDEYENILHLYADAQYRLERYEKLKLINNIEVNNIVEELINKEEE